MRRAGIVFLFMGILALSATAQPYLHLSAVRAASDSIVRSLVGEEIYLSRVVPMPEKTTVGRDTMNRWIYVEIGNRDTIITQRYTASLEYKVYPPDRRDIFALLWVSLVVWPNRIEFTTKGDLEYQVNRKVLLPQSYGTGFCVFQKTTELKHRGEELAARELTRQFGKKVFENEFKVSQVSAYPWIEGYTNDRGEEYEILHDYRINYHVHPIDDTAITTWFEFDLYAAGNYDTVGIKAEMKTLPECLRTGENCNILSAKQAIARALKLGLPEGTKGPLYKTFLRREGARFVWQVLSIDTYQYSVDLIGHPCEYSSGELMTIDAITGVLINRREDSYREGCLD